VAFGAGGWLVLFLAIPWACPFSMAGARPGDLLGWEALLFANPDEWAVKTEEGRGRQKLHLAPGRGVHEQQVDNPRGGTQKRGMGEWQGVCGKEGGAGIIRH